MLVISTSWPSSRGTPLANERPAGRAVAPTVVPVVRADEAWPDAHR
jgi:hypothetical protein